MNTAKEEIHLNFENGQISLQRDPIAMINAWGNYIKIYIIVKNVVVQIVRRGKLKNTMKELMKFEEYFQCYHSYIINVKHIKKISGNDKKADAIIKTGHLKAPISRENIKIISELFEKSQHQKLFYSNP